MASPALAPIKPRAAVPHTNLTHFIEVDDWVVKELERPTAPIVIEGAIKSLSIDGLTRAIQALSKVEEFVHDRAAQRLIGFMEEELAARTV